MAFKYTGFADEADSNFDAQIDVLKEVGWSAIELRGIDGTSVCDLDQTTWDSTLAKLNDNGIQVVAFGGQIANWARPITGEFQKDIDELERCAPRMKAAGADMIRIMSYPNDQDAPLANDAWRDEAVRRLSELAMRAEDLGVILGHENCSGYGGIGPEQYLELKDAIDSPAFKLIFDTGNNSLHDNDREATWRYYEQCRDEIMHVHIKSGLPGDDGVYRTCFPDEDPVQARILSDLVVRGYDGWLSIEPHIAAAVHLGREPEGDDARRIWIDYAHRIEQIAEAAANTTA
tara:strand:- start:100 stop:966 length:867 start_codon:yes stop_codon:yes gene_type:complete